MLCFRLYAESDEIRKEGIWRKKTGIQGMHWHSVGGVAVAGRGGWGAVAYRPTIAWRVLRGAGLRCAK